MELLRAVDGDAARKKDRDGRTIIERFAEETPLMLPLPERPYDARKVVAVHGEPPGTGEGGGRRLLGVVSPEELGCDGLRRPRAA